MIASGFQPIQAMIERAYRECVGVTPMSVNPTVVDGPVLGSRVAQARVPALKAGQVVRSDGPQSHLSKSGTPTMGGALILISIGITTVLWADLSNRFVWVVLIVTLGILTGMMGIVGWVYTTWLRIKHGYPLENSWGKAIYPKNDNEAIERMRQGRAFRQPGFDGEYGVIRLFADGELARLGR